MIKSDWGPVVVLGMLMCFSTVCAAYVFLNSALKVYFPLVGLGIGVCWISQLLFALRGLILPMIVQQKVSG